MKKPIPRKPAAKPAANTPAATVPTPLPSRIVSAESLNALAATRSGDLAYWLGPQVAADLAASHARALSSDRPRGSRGTVYLLPGIMGSSLGTLNPDGSANELWLTPRKSCQIMFGALERLALDETGDANIGAVGVLGYLWSFYQEMAETLMDEGYTVKVFAFDWRRSIAGLGRELARGIEVDSASEVRVVAHSMGGLVTRAAIRAGNGLPKLKRLVMLGTPNLGSFSPVEVFRGVHGLANWIALADFTNDKTELAQRVYTSFAGLTEMLPRFQAKTDYFDLAAWPAKGIKPRPAVLKEAKKLAAALAPRDERFTLVAGVEQETIVSAQIDAAGEFRFTQTMLGDGTVPLVSARFEPALRTFFISESHGALPNNEDVRADIVRLLDGKAPERLATKPPAELRLVARALSESERKRQQLRTLEAIQATAAVRRQTAARASGQRQPELEVEPEALRHVLSDFLRHASDRPAPSGLAPSYTPAPSVASVSALSASVAAADSDGAGAPSAASLNGVVIGRRSMRRLEIELLPGSLTRANCRAYAVGVYQNVALSGASFALDRALDGALSGFLERRMISGRVGEIFTLPAGRRRLRTDTLLFAGLGPFDRCDAGVQRMVAENLIRTLAAMHIEEFACVLMGTAVTGNAAAALEEMMRGFLAGLQEADPEGRFRRIVLCERDPARLAELRQTLLRLATSELCSGVELTFSEPRELPPEIELAAGERAQSGPVSAASATPNYLLVRQISDLGSQRGARPADVRGAVETQGVQFQISFLGSVGRAAIAQETVLVNRTVLDDLLASIRQQSFHPEQFGRELADLLLPPGIQQQLREAREVPLTVIHDAAASRIPWELLALPAPAPTKGAAKVQPVLQPALSGGLSRRYLAQNLATAKWRDEDRTERALRILIVQNPTGDLKGAQEEGERLLKAFSSDPRLQVHLLAGPAALKARLQAEFASGQYDVIHYAGHGYFDPSNPSEGGLICAGNEVLTGTEVSAMDRLPSLVFLNACEVGRIRGLAAAPSARGPRFRESSLAHGNRNVSLAEAFVRGGVASFLSTYWPVGDAAALDFAQIFYKQLVEGRPMGPAVLEARRAIRNTRDWADYLLYGSPDFRVKLAEG